MKITLTRLKTEWKKNIEFFKSRDEYIIELRGWIKKYGLANLPASVQRTVPTDMKVLYEIRWWLQPFVWIRIIQITWHNAQNEGMKVAMDG